MKINNGSAYVDAVVKLNEFEYMIVQNDNIEILELAPYKSFNFNLVDSYDGEVLLKKYNPIKNLVIK